MGLMAYCREKRAGVEFYESKIIHTKEVRKICKKIIKLNFLNRLQC